MVQSLDVNEVGEGQTGNPFLLFLLQGEERKLESPGVGSIITGGDQGG